MLSRITRTRQLNLCGLQRRSFLTHNNHCRVITRKAHQYDFIDSNNYTYDIRVDNNGRYYRLYDELQRTGKSNNNKIEYTDSNGELFYVTEMTEYFKKEIRHIHVQYIICNTESGLIPYIIEQNGGNINGVHIVKKPLNLFYRIPTDDESIMVAQLIVPVNSVIVIDWKHPTLHVGKFRASKVSSYYQIYKYKKIIDNFHFRLSVGKEFKIPSFKTLNINDPDTGISGYFDLNTLLQSHKKRNVETN